MITLTIDYNNKDLDFFNSLDKELMDARQRMLERVGIYMLARTRENFAESKDVFMKNFEPIKPRKNGSFKPIVKTASLQNSFIVEQINNGILIKTSINYASYHNDGTDKIKKRQFLPKNYLPKNYESEILAIIENSLKFES